MNEQLTYLHSLLCHLFQSQKIYRCAIETLHSPTVKSLPPSTEPSHLTLEDSEGNQQRNGPVVTQSNTSSEPAATVLAYPSKTSASPHPPSPLASSTQSTISSLFPRSATSSTKTPLSLLEICTNAPYISSGLRTSSIADTLDTATICREHNAMCEKADNEHTLKPTADNNHQKQQCLQRTESDALFSAGCADLKANPISFPVVRSLSLTPLILEPSPYNAASRPPIIPRALPFSKKRSSLYTHQSMAQSDSQIDHHVPYSATATRSNDRRQYGSVLASISSTFFGIGSSSRSRNYSNTSSVSLATTQSFATVSNSTKTKRHSQASHAACAQPPPVPINLATNRSAKPPNFRPFPHFFNTDRQYPMSTPAHSQSTPALLSHDQVDVVTEPFALCQTGCTCPNKQPPGSCLFHKKLPALPVPQLEDPAGLIKEKMKSSRISVMSTTASIRSLFASIKKPRSRAASVQSLAELDAPFARESQLQSQSNTSLPFVQPRESTQNHGCSLAATRRRNRKEPPSIVRRAVKRHVGADVPLPASPGLSKDNLGFQQAKQQAFCGLKGRTFFPSSHSSQQSLPHTGQLYLYPTSVSTPCLVHPVPSTKATTINKHTARSMSTIARIQQATESTPNLSLQGRAHVSAVNAHAEIVVRPQIAGASATSSQGGDNLIASSNAFLPPIERSRCFMPVPSPVHRTGPYSKENATFFEPFQAQSKSRGGKSSSYVSFHFDLSHLEKAEHEDEYDSASTTKANVNRAEQDGVDGSDDDDDEDAMDNLRCDSSSPSVHPSMSLPNVTLSSTDLLPVHLRNRATLPPPPPPPRSRPQGANQGDSSGDKDDDPFQTLHQHLMNASRYAPTSASASSPSLRLPSQPRSDQQHSLKRLLGYGKAKSKHRSHNEGLSRAREATNLSTVSLPAMLSSFLPSSASTASLPLHSDQTHLDAEPCLAGRGSKPSRNRWIWMWWKNSNKSPDTDKDVSWSRDA